MARAQEPQQAIGGQLGQGVLESLTQGRAMAENRLINAMRMQGEAQGAKQSILAQTDIAKQANITEQMKVQNEQRRIALEAVARDKERADRLAASVADRESMEKIAEKGWAAQAARDEKQREYDTAMKEKDYALAEKIAQDVNDMDTVRMLWDQNHKRNLESFAYKTLELQREKQTEEMKLRLSLLQAQKKADQLAELREKRGVALAANIATRKGSVATNPAEADRLFNENASLQGVPHITLELLSNPYELSRKIASREITHTQLMTARDILEKITAAAQEDTTGAAEERTKIEVAKTAAQEEFTQKAEEGVWGIEPPALVAPIGSWVAKRKLARELAKQSEALKKLDLADVGSAKLKQAMMSLTSLTGDRTPVTGGAGTVGDVVSQFLAIADEETTGAELAMLEQQLGSMDAAWKAYTDLLSAPNADPLMIREEVYRAQSPGVQKLLTKFGMMAPQIEFQTNVR